MTAKIGAQVEGSIAGNEQWIVTQRSYQWPSRWNDCEPTPGSYTWPDWMDYNYSLLGAKQIIGTRTCPRWARLWVDNLGSPPKPECYINYAVWLCALIARYHPWAIEVWNEPDCREQDASLNYFGAWYDRVSWFSSGARYGEFCKVVYKYVKRLYPAVKILVGALMNVNENESRLFLKGAKAGGLRGDYLSYHCYITERAGFDRIFTLSKQLKKIARLQTICTETSVLAWDDTDALRLLQRDYLQYLVNKLRYPLLSYPVQVNWYTLAGNSWLNSDLIHNNQSTPAYEVFKNAR